MTNKYASGKRAIAECDRCGFRCKRKELRRITIKTKGTALLVCRTCWEPDQPQLQLGMYPVSDPQAIRDPRRDNSYWQSGLDGLQLKVRGEVPSTSTSAFGTSGEGSRVIQWGWGPVGLSNPLALSDLPNTLVGVGAVGTVTVSTGN